MVIEDYYQILGVLPDAEDVVIRAAYLALCKRYHPDKVSQSSDKTDAVEKMALINEAYSTLSNPSKRAAYDAQRKQSQAQSARTNKDARSETEEWVLACEFFPHLNSLEQELTRLDADLADEFKAHILENKAFHDAEKIAKSFETNFLSSYFGDDPILHAYVKELILKGQKNAARETSKILQTFGDTITVFEVMDKIDSKYFPDKFFAKQQAQAQRETEWKEREFKSKEPFPLKMLFLFLLVSIFIYIAVVYVQT